jgi:regulation of enolase protein 1 (concanavalin A-like superfamily)
MRRILIAVLLASAMILPSVQAQEEDLCSREAIIASFAEATDIVVWSQQYSTCPGQVQRAVRALASGYQLLTTEFLPFAAADNVNLFSPIWKWYPGASSSYSIDPATNIVYLIAGGLSEQRDDITTAPVLAYPVVGDVTAQVKITFSPLDETNGAGFGIRAAQDSNSWIRIARVGDVIEVVAATRGTSTVVDSQLYEEGANDVYFKIERVGDLFTLSYSVDGTDWKEVTSDSNETFPEETELFVTTFWPVENGAAQAIFSEMTVSED